MSGSDAGGSALAWAIPPDVDPEAADHGGASGAGVRELAEELERACRPERVSVEVVPGGVSRIDLRFPDRDAAFQAFDAAAARVRAHPGILCRVVATSPGPVG